MKTKKLQIEVLYECMMQKALDKINAEREKQKKEYLDAVESLAQSFRDSFVHYLVMLKEAGIKWTAKFNDQRYIESSGGYIEFVRGKKTLLMDFNSGTNYRYEYTGSKLRPERTGTMVFDNWDKDMFVIFIYNGLIKN